MANIYNSKGLYVATRSSDPSLLILPSDAAAVLSVESGGHGFDANTGLMIGKFRCEGHEGEGGRGGRKDEKRGGEEETVSSKNTSCYMRMRVAVVRFEIHIFYKYFTNSGEDEKRLAFFNNHYQFDPDKHWLAHKWRRLVYVLVLNFVTPFSHVFSFSFPFHRARRIPQ